MIVKTIKTHKIISGDDLYTILDKYIKSLKENSIVIVTSKIVSICEDNIVKFETADKMDLIIKEAEYYIPKYENKYNVTLTIKNNILAAGAGLDESNGNGYFILWPKDPQKSVNKIRTFLKNKFKLKKIGVIISDSKTTPLRWGTTGVALSHSGFQALENYIGTPDIFNSQMRVTKASIMDGLAATAVLVMGEGAQQTPLAIIEDVPFVKFKDQNPTSSELAQLAINIEDDLYSKVLKSAPWKKGGS